MHKICVVPLSADIGFAVCFGGVRIRRISQLSCPVGLAESPELQ